MGVLGYSLNEEMTLPEHVAKRLKIVSYLYHWGFARCIALSGKWTTGFEKKSIKSPVTEAKAMGKILLEYSIPHQVILYEEESRSTIENAYYLKTRIFIPGSLRSALILCADYHIARVQYVFSKVFGKEYYFDYYATESDRVKKAGYLEKEETTLRETKKFFEGMPDGKDNYLKKRIEMPVIPNQT